MSNAAHSTETEALAKFNRRMANDARALHDSMAEAGHAVTPEEAKFLLVAGWAALGEVMGVDTAPLNTTLKRLASELS